jgi:ubiquinone biosynthesis protein
MEQETQTSPVPQTKGARYRQIMATLARHGIGSMLGADDAARARHVREACEELGTTFIKLGQLLSTRADLLSAEYRDELRKLQDSVAPIPARDVAQIIREELGAPPDEIFAFFDPEATASASIGQVHAARLADGREVMVKVRKPGVEQVVDMDLEILADEAKKWIERFPVLEPYDIPGLLREFSDTLRNELDYTKEAANVRYFGEQFGTRAGYALPQVIEEYSRARVITLTRADGMRPEDATGLTKRRRSTAARRICEFVIEPALSHGVFYADPHGGNFLIRENGVVAVVDFGMVGRLTPEARRRVADVFVAIDRRDAERLTDRIVEIAAPAHPVDRAGIATEIDRMLERYVGETLENVRFGEAIGELLELVRRNRMRLPGNYALLFKALIMVEGLLQVLDPNTNLGSLLEPLTDKLVYGQMSGDQWLNRARDSALDAAQLSIELPRRVDRVLGQIERGNVRVWTRVEDLDATIARFERVVERANATMLAAACIVALAIVMLFYHPQGWQRWIPVIFWIAVAAAVIHVVRTLLALRRR